MGEKRKLLAALDAYKGRDVKAERQKKLRKQAEKRKKAKQGDDISGEESGNDSSNDRVDTNALEEGVSMDGDGWETEESERAPTAVCVNWSVHERSCSLLISLR